MKILLEEIKSNWAVTSEDPIKNPNYSQVFHVLNISKHSLGAKLRHIRQAFKPGELEVPDNNEISPRPTFSFNNNPSPMHQLPIYQQEENPYKLNSFPSPYNSSYPRKTVKY